MSEKPRYTVRPVMTPVPQRRTDERPNHRTSGRDQADASGAADPFLRPPTEDDDGYDPFSDRPPAPEPPFQEDPWR